ncbi:MAG: alpha/beta fold hydrolase [Deltaproteobacteria bacterium]|nr:MAG: alpha/beta fold hydrolase [Deltaproteobacteria bacterium]
MGRWRTLGGELSALGTLALSLPLGRLLPRERFDPAAPHPTPVVLVHGFLGDPSNFLVLRSFLSRYGVRSFASFSYPPRLDYQRLAPRLGQKIARVCRETGFPRVDVVGHSLGGLVARHLVEQGDGSRVGRLVTLGSPYFSERRPSRELAILGAHDPLVPAPAVPRGRVVVIEDCGHWNLLYHPAMLGAVARFLARSAEASAAARAAA